MTRTLDIDFRQLRNRNGMPIVFNAAQRAFLYSLVPRLAYFSGFGGGKTLAFICKAIALAAANGPGYQGLLIAPTFEMFERVLLPTIRDDVLMQLGDPESGHSLWDLSRWHASSKCLTLPWGFRLWFGSADRPIMSRGSNMAFVGIDEASLIRNFSELWRSATSRARRAAKHQLTRKSLRQVFIDTTPEGYDPVYDVFVRGPEDKESRARWREQHQVLRSSMLDNPGLDPEYIEEMRIDIPASLHGSYIEGQHQEVSSGLAYYEFRPEVHLRDEARYDPAKELHLSWDFNKDPMSLTIWQIMGQTEAGLRTGASLLMTIGEIVLRNSNTPEVCREFIRRYGREGLNHALDIHIHGDATDAVGVSNYDEIESWLRSHFHGRIIRRIPMANPMHRRRLKSVNGLLRNVKGEVRWWIHPSCKWLARDLRRQQMDEKQKGQKNKKQESGDGTTLGHVADTADYVIETLCPYRRPIARERVSRLVNWHDQQGG